MTINLDLDQGIESFSPGSDSGASSPLPLDTNHPAETTDLTEARPMETSDHLTETTMKESTREHAEQILQPIQVRLELGRERLMTGSPRGMFREGVWDFPFDRGFPAWILLSCVALFAGLIVILPRWY
jgi:hypothetical protein